MPARATPGSITRSTAEAPRTGTGKRQTNTAARPEGKVVVLELGMLQVAVGLAQELELEISELATVSAAEQEVEISLLAAALALERKISP